MDDDLDAEAAEFMEDVETWHSGLPSDHAAGRSVLAAGDDRPARVLGQGFALQDERLKDAEAADYFDELLARIREIRAAEKQ